MKIFLKGIIVVLFFVISASLVTIALEIGGVNIGPIPFLIYANLFGFLTMLIFIYFDNRSGRFLKLLHDYKRFILILIIGASVSIISELFLLIGTINTNPNIASIVYRAYPLFILLITPFLIKQKIKLKHIIALLFAFFSMFIVLYNGANNIYITFNFNWLPYVILLIISAFIIAVTTLLIKKYNIDSILFMAISAAEAFVFFLSLAFIEHIPLIFSFSIPALISLLFIGIIDFGIGGVLFYYSYKILNPSTTGIAMLSVPFLTFLFSFVLLGEKITIYYLLAALLILFAILIQGKDLFYAPEYRYNRKYKNEKKLKEGVTFDITNTFISNKIFSDRLSAGEKAVAIKLPKKDKGRLKFNNNVITIEINEDKDFITKEEKYFIKYLTNLKEDEELLIIIGAPNKIDKIIENIEDRLRQLF
ncbi:MAG: DMT family transporter [Candidatus Micrarchaeia archaeon]